MRYKRYKSIKVMLVTVCVSVSTATDTARATPTARTDLTPAGVTSCWRVRHDGHFLLFVETECAQPTDQSMHGDTDQQNGRSVILLSQRLLPHGAGCSGGPVL